MRYEAHVQAYVRDRVVVLEMLAELAHLRALREKRKAPYVNVHELVQIKVDSDGRRYKAATYRIVSQ